MGSIAILFLLVFPAHASADDLIDRARDGVKGHLRDPESALFDQLTIKVAFDNYRKERRVLCGMVNARNATGGYVGRTQFFYFIDQDEINAVGNHEMFDGFINPFLGESAYRRYCE
jgi:hypothetical protein